MPAAEQRPDSAYTPYRDKATPPSPEYRIPADGRYRGASATGTGGTSGGPPGRARRPGRVTRRTSRPRTGRLIVIAVVIAGAIGWTVSRAQDSPEATTAGGDSGEVDLLQGAWSIRSARTITPLPQLSPAGPGWQSTADIAARAAYDVPAGWRVFPRNHIGGYEKQEPHQVIGGTALSAYHQVDCDGYAMRALAGMAPLEPGEPAGRAAARVAASWADFAFTAGRRATPVVTVSAPEQLVLRGGRRAVHVTATAVPATQDGCVPPRGVVHVVAPATADGFGPLVLVLVLHQDIADAIDDATARGILTSFRPVEPAT